MSHNASVKSPRPMQTGLDLVEMLSDQAVPKPVLLRVPCNLTVTIAAVTRTPVQKCVCLVIVELHAVDDVLGKLSVMLAAGTYHCGFKLFKEQVETFIRKREQGSGLGFLRIFPSFK